MEKVYPHVQFHSHGWKSVGLPHWGIHKMESKMGSVKWVGGWGGKNSQNQSSQSETGSCEEVGRIECPWKGGWRDFSQLLHGVVCARSELREVVRQKLPERRLSVFLRVPNLRVLPGYSLGLSKHGKHSWETLEASLLSHVNYKSKIHF